ncbi:prepilin peptidase [Pseudohaliea rubra]|uniref:Prepilin leader peptidase/N-methyltransferase n=1 Tax=Pseudohaliea rubra DSM 19751 TaxID=1265313 RepID=A0A095VV27_9GAMM|nr:A24 family peptidase [Pseudohaliea rubra]KGE05317.1 Leader peptidase (Prepilin peptidase)/ N-methyltransferase [Pseudohaliea rubra DSM 19751]
MIVDWLLQHPAWWVGIVGVLGLVVGSFLNVVILRLPRMLEAQWQRDCRELLAEGELPEENVPAFSLAYPPSHCPACSAPIRPWHNIPVLSYLALRGRCADCRAPIALRYPLVEAATAAISVAVALHVAPGLAAAAALVFSWALIALTGIDIDHQLLPDDITLPLLWAGLLFNLATGTVPLADAVAGAAAGYLLLWGVYWLFKLLTGKEGMGYGDFKLLAALGAWLGWQLLPLVILLSSLVGAVIGIAGMVLLGRGRDVPIPFGPYLAAAGWIALLWGDPIIHYWFGMLQP